MRRDTQERIAAHVRHERFLLSSLPMAERLAIKNRELERKKEATERWYLGEAEFILGEMPREDAIEKIAALLRKE